MMAKMFYTLEETKSALGRSEEEIKQLAREGRLREFRDGPRLMFKADQVEQLKGELDTGEVVDLGVSDSGGMIGLVDTTGASGTSITLSDADTGQSSQAGMRMKDDTSLSVDLGLSGTMGGSLGGVPSPGRPAGGGSGLSGTSSGSRGGVNVFTADDTGVEHVDPSAQTAITPGFRQQMALEGVGSGSGLLDLTRESDDTSLGAVLDEITPAGATRAGGTIAGGDAGLVGFEDDLPSSRAVAAPAQYVERPDPLAPAFGAAALAGFIAMLFGVFVLISAMAGTRPDLVRWFQDQGLMMTAVMGLGLAGLMFVIGLVAGRVASR